MEADDLVDTPPGPLVKTRGETPELSGTGGVRRTRAGRERGKEGGEDHRGEEGGKIQPVTCPVPRAGGKICPCTKVEATQGSIGYKQNKLNSSQITIDAYLHSVTIAMISNRQLL